MPVTMDSLINGMEHGTPYEREVCLAALKITGPLAYAQGDLGIFLYAYESFVIPPIRIKLTNATEQRIPEEIWPAIHPDNRGEDFPPSVPFVPIT